MTRAVKGVAGKPWTGSGAASGAWVVPEAQDLIDGRSDGAVAVVEVLARAGLVGVVAVHGHVAAVGVVDAVGLVGGPDQLLDAVALADVGHQLDQCGVGCIGHGVGVLGVAGDFDGDGAVVVLAAGSAPGAICLIDGQTDGAIPADDIVGGALAVGSGEVVAALLRRPLAHDAVDRDGVDGVVAGAGLVLGDVGVRYAELLTQKKSMYSDYKKAQEQMRELQTAKANVDRILNMEIPESEKEKEAEQR